MPRNNIVRNVEAPIKDLMLNDWAIRLVNGLEMVSIKGLVLVVIGMIHFASIKKFLNNYV